MRFSLPKATTFEQGQRQLFGLLMAASGIFVGVVALALLVFIGLLAFKFPDHRLTLIYILGGSLGAYLVMQSIVMISMAVGGPVGRLKVSASKEGASFEASEDGQDEVAS